MSARAVKHKSVPVANRREGGHDRRLVRRRDHDPGSNRRHASCSKWDGGLLSWVHIAVSKPTRVNRDNSERKASCKCGERNRRRQSSGVGWMTRE